MGIWEFFSFDVEFILICQAKAMHDFEGFWGFRWRLFCIVSCQGAYEILTVWVSKWPLFLDFAVAGQSGIKPGIKSEGSCIQVNGYRIKAGFIHLMADLYSSQHLTALVCFSLLRGRIQKQSCSDNEILHTIEKEKKKEKCCGVETQEQSSLPCPLKRGGPKAGKAKFRI